MVLTPRRQLEAAQDLQHVELAITGLDAESLARSDRDALNVAVTGRTAFTQLMNRYRRRLVYGLAVRVLRDKALADEAVTVAFSKAYTALPGFRADSTTYTWLYRVTYNTCVDMLRRRERAARQDEAGRHMDEAASPVEDDTADRRKQKAAGFLGPRMGKLPARLRDILWMREVDGLSYSALAAAMGVPVGTVMSRLHYARHRLLLAEKVPEPPVSPQPPGEQPKLRRVIRPQGSRKA